MRQFPYFLLFISLLTGCQRNSFTIEGTTEELNEGDTLFLVRDINTGFPSDTMIVGEETFSLKGVTDSALLGFIYAQKDPEISTTLFLEPGTIEIHLTDSLQKTIIGGTAANNALQEANYIAYRYGEKMKEIANLLSNNPIDSTSVLLAKSQLNRLKKDMTKRIKGIAERNADNAFGKLINNNLEED